jgi:hypothetical protein
MAGCEEPGEHELSCRDCGGTIGYLCDKHIFRLEAQLEAGRAVNANRERERNEKSPSQ